MKLIVTFFVVFVLGPVLFWRLARPAPSRHRIAALMACAILLMIVAFGIATWMAPMYEPSPYPGLAVIVASWLSWIVVLAYCALALRYRIKSRPLQKVIFAIGAMATTLPWFGLYTAQMLAEE
ncbi:hypothetical protein AAFO92_17815 [Roseovarius sp. CAU 1744]|uniref:hypothetical protein n=1 Tax=Roseovarius sp. CAU 1744 TaxID=3140368 RepID=UPI00325B3BC0